MEKFVVIGKNINYSISPIIHNANFKSLNIDAFYEILNIDDIDIEIDKLRYISGFNVTIPYKEKMFKLCDYVYDEALYVKAVNCIKVIDGLFYGYNTDIYGFYKLLDINNLLNLNDKKVLIIGAGGSAKAVYYTFTKFTKYDTYITNRTYENALKITDKIINFNNIILDEFDIIVNCTNVGVKSLRSPIKIDKIKKDACFIDINYQSESKFLNDAKLKNAKTINGLDMLIYQGAKSFEIWFNKQADLQVIKQSIRKDL